MNITLQDSYYPILHYFEYDFLNLYEMTWANIEENWKKQEGNAATRMGFLNHEASSSFFLTDAACAQFYLLYSNNHFPATTLADFFYGKQEANGAIRAEYDKDTLSPVVDKENPEGLCSPLLLWSEYNYFNKTDNKKRLKEIVPKLDAYLSWIRSVASAEDGLFHAPLNATLMPVSYRKNVHYPIDFNAMMAMSFFYMSQLANFTNHRVLVIKYSKLFYHLKSLINAHFWDDTDKIYYDLDQDKKPIRIKTLLSFLPMLSSIPNEDRVSSLMEYLKDPKHFYTQHPFPTLSLSDPHYTSGGQYFKGSTHPLFNFLIIKGLELYQKHTFAHECILKHLYGMLSVYNLKEEEYANKFWKAYHSTKPLPAKSQKKGSDHFPNYHLHSALSTITLMIENVIGIEINLPKKMLHWVISSLEEMGIEHIQLKKNYVSTMIIKSKRGWEIRHSAEKLYYFSVDILEMNKKKTLPFPSGRCALLLEKL